MLNKKSDVDESVVGIVVTSDTIGKKHRTGLSSFFTKRIFVWGFMILVAMLIGATAMLTFKTARQPDDTASRQRDSLIDQSVKYFEPQDSAKLKTYVDKLKSNKTSANDPSSLYVIATYYVNISDTQNATKYLDKLDSLKPKASDYRPSLRDYLAARTVEALRKDTQFARQLDAESLKNTQNWDVR